MLNCAACTVQGTYHQFPCRRKHWDYYYYYHWMLIPVWVDFYYLPPPLRHPKTHHLHLLVLVAFPIQLIPQHSVQLELYDPLNRQFFVVGCKQNQSLDLLNLHLFQLVFFEGIVCKDFLPTYSNFPIPTQPSIQGAGMTFPCT